MPNTLKEIVKKLFEDQSTKLSCPQCKSTNTCRTITAMIAILISKDAMLKLDY